MADDIRDWTTPEQLMEHVERIAQYVRLSGDAEERKAFDYIEEKLQEWGVAYQRLEHPAYISLPGAAALTLSVAGRSYELNCITHSMAVSTPDRGLTGQVVDVGAGLAADYADFPKGAIALIDGLATPFKTMIACQQGAAGAIFLNGAELHEMIVSPVWGSPSAARVDLLPTIPVVSVLGVDGKPIRQALQEGAAVQATLFAEVLTEWRPIPLLVADIEGTEYPEELVLLGGHVDSWHYGAMDNASANAVQLEALRVFQARRDRLKRSLRVAFWSGHSHGRYAGSTWYADEHWDELAERLVLHMYVDSVGGQGATVLSQAWAMAETLDVGRDALALEMGEAFEGGRFGRGGDQSFYGIGVSCLYMCLSEQPPITDPTQANVSQLLGGNGKTGGLGSWWHAVDDTIDKLDPAFLHRDARIYLYSLARYLEEPRLALDFRATVSELQGYLQVWQEKAGSRFSLQGALTACEELQAAIRDFYERSGREDFDKQVFNQTVVQLARRLVPLNYSTGNRFEHDLALWYPPIPALQPIEELVQTTPGSAEEQHLLVLLKRRLNFVKETLRQATRCTRENQRYENR